MRHAALLAIPLALLCIVGCGGMGRFNVEIALDHQGFRKELNTVPSVEVNLVGVNASEFPVWQGYSVTKYWTPDDSQRVTAVRQQRARVFTFGEQPPFLHTLQKWDPIWDTWKGSGAMHLFVLSNYPRVASDVPGDADVRRVILPLSKRRWRSYAWYNRLFGFRKRLLHLEVTPSGVVNHTPPKPE